MKFFISYTAKNEAWAKWIVWELENAKQRYRCIAQFRDFAPGMSFMQKMRAAAEAECTIAVFSSDYFRSRYCLQELDAALTGDENRLLPIRVGECKPGRFIANRIFIDLAGKPIEDAREMLLSGAEAYVTQTLRGQSGRKFRQRPDFPGGAESVRSSASPVASVANAKGPLKVLFLGPELGGLKPRAQFREMQAGVAAARQPDSVVLKGVFKARIGNFFEELNRESPDVFHFSGKQNGGDILMRLDDGSLTAVSDMALAGMFRSLDRGLRLVIIDTCYSLRCARTIARAVPCSMGVEGSPYEEEAVMFYKQFYQAVASGKSLKDAVAKAQTSLRFVKVPPERIPQLCCRPGTDPSKIVLAR